MNCSTKSVREDCAVLIVASNLVTSIIERPIGTLESLQVIGDFSNFIAPDKELLGQSGIRMFIRGPALAFLSPTNLTDQRIDLLLVTFFGVAQRCKNYDSSRTFTNKPVEVFGGMDIGVVVTLDTLANEGPVKKASELSKLAQRNELGLIMTSAIFERLGEQYKRLLKVTPFGRSALNKEDFCIEKIR